MPKVDQANRGRAAPAEGGAAIYSPTARAFHWTTVIALMVLIPAGFWMTSRAELNIWDATTNTLYSSHKLLGYAVLWLVVARLAYRLYKGTPQQVASLSPIQKLGSEGVHWALYIGLFAMAITGWLGTSAFPALSIFGLFELPALTSPDKAFSKEMFEWHHLIARVLLGLIALHFAAALVHAIFLRDGVFQRMWPRRV